MNHSEELGYVEAVEVLMNGCKRWKKAIEAELDYLLSIGAKDEWESVAERYRWQL